MSADAETIIQATAKLDEAVAEFCRTVHDGAALSNWYLVTEVQHLDRPAALKLAESPRMTPWLRLGIIRFVAGSLGLI